MKAKVLVTGGAGYLGSILVPALLENNYSVTVLDNFMYGQSSLNGVCYHSDFKIVNCDVRVENVVKAYLKDADFIIPLAALVGAPICNKDPVGAETINRDSVLMMLDNLSKNQKLIMPTTNSAYGSGDEENFCTEDSPLNPISRYAIEKVEVEKRLMDHSNAISFRLATVFGMSPRMRIDLLVNDFVYRAFKDKAVVLFESHFKRNYIHVRDVTRAFLHAMNNFSKMKGNIYNVGLSDANLSKYELCVRIKEQIPEFVFLDAKIGKDPDQRNYIVSNEKIEKTGYRPKFTIPFGITELLRGYRMLRNNYYGNV